MLQTEVGDDGVVGFASCAVPLLQLLAKIKAAIARQWQKKNQSVDWDLLERMEQHQKAVDSAIVAQSARGEG